MYKTISIIILTILFYISIPLSAEPVHKWVDEDGVTHYSDEPPSQLESEVTLIELPAKHTTAPDAENDYYSISNQWMRVHEERIAREQIKLEKAKIKASQRPAEPSVVYVNESEYGYGYGYPYRYRHKYRHKRKDKHHRRGDKKDSTRHYGDKHANQNKRSNLNKSGDGGRGRQTHSRRATKGLTVTAK